jgi:hypothetical protein
VSRRPADATSVTATMDFCPPGEKVVFYPTDRKKSQWPYAPHEVTIHDVRPIASELTLERNGFVFVEHRSACSDFYDNDEVERVYVPEVKALIAELTGADKVVTFGMMTRTSRKDAAEGNLPAFGAHVDYGDYTVRRFATEILGETEASRWLAGRYMLINVWRPIRVVESAPFAVCDGSTVAASDLCDSEVRGGLGDPNRPTLYGHAVSFNANQRWYWAPRMRPDEVLVFKLYDSDVSAVQRAAHSAFAYPGIPPDAPPRESIELRTIAFLNPGSEPFSQVGVRALLKKRALTPT